MCGIIHTVCTGCDYATEVFKNCHLLIDRLQPGVYLEMTDCEHFGIHYVPVPVGLCKNFRKDPDTCGNWVLALQSRMESMNEEEKAAAHDAHVKFLWESVQTWFVKQNKGLRRQPIRPQRPQAGLLTQSFQEIQKAVPKAEKLYRKQLRNQTIAAQFHEPDYVTGVYLKEATVRGLWFKPEFDIRERKPSLAQASALSKIPGTWAPAPEPFSISVSESLDSFQKQRIKQQQTMSAPRKCPDQPHQVTMDTINEAEEGIEIFEDEPEEVPAAPLSVIDEGEETDLYDASIYNDSTTNPSPPASLYCTPRVEEPHPAKILFEKITTNITTKLTSFWKLCVDAVKETDGYMPMTTAYEADLFTTRFGDRL